MINLEGAPSRQAALMLYAMSPSDRDWILSTLDSADVQKLTGLMDELRSLEVVPDRAWLAPLMSRGQSVNQTTSTAFVPGAAHGHTPTEYPINWGNLSVDQIRALSEMLSAEPVQITIWLLSTRTWPWREQLIRSLSGDLQMRVRQELRSGSVGLCECCSADGYPLSASTHGVSLQRAVLAVLDRRLQGIPSAESNTKHSSGESARSTVASRLLQQLRSAFQGYQRG